MIQHVFLRLGSKLRGLRKDRFPLDLIVCSFMSELPSPAKALFLLATTVQKQFLFLFKTLVVFKAFLKSFSLLLLLVPILNFWC